MLISYFSSLFTSANFSVFEPVLEGVLPRVSWAMNEELLRPFEPEEVSLLWNADTAPGPSGFPPLFYKQFWNKVGVEVTKAVLSALILVTIPKDLNYTYLPLIPKIQSPRKVTDFQMISLSNVLYKLIAKVLANRSKPRLPQLISETQSAFMLERLITNNILVAHETLHYLKAKRSGKMGYMALKLDMRKAYDRVEWKFPEQIMQKLGFDSKWIQLISTCIWSLSYSIMLNGQPHGLISPTRGLR